MYVHVCINIYVHTIYMYKYKFKIVYFDLLCKSKNYKK